MKKIPVLITRLNQDSDLPLPKYATDLSSGLDLLADISEPITIEPFSRVLIPTGIAIEIPEGMEAQVRSRSGLAYKNGIITLTQVNYKYQILLDFYEKNDARYLDIELFYEMKKA